MEEIRTSADLKNFTPILDSLVERYDLITAALYGRIWRYCQGDLGICAASNDTLAEELDISTRTVIRKKKKLENDGYIKTIGKSKDNIKCYATTKQAGIKIEASAFDKDYDLESLPSEGCDRESQSESREGVTESHTKKDFKKDNNKKEKKQEKKEKDLLLAASGINPNSNKKSKFKNPDWVPPDLKDGNRGRLWITWCNLFLKLRPNKNFLSEDKRWINEIRDWDNTGYKPKHIKAVWEKLKPEDFAYVSSPKSLNTKLQTLTAKEEYPDVTDPAHVHDW